MNAHVNWIGYKTIVRKEVVRILRIWAQTVVPLLYRQPSQ